jgi:hypothetical protein
MVIQLLCFIQKTFCRDENDKVPKGSTVNSTEFQDFTRLVDIILARNIRITTLSELVGIQPKVYS